MSECEKILICGDMNARVGEEQVRSEIEELDNGVKTRTSMDKIVNGEGKRLIGLCEELGLILMDRRAQGGEEGKLTFVGAGEGCNGFVIDMVVCVDREDNSWFKSMDVLIRCESDHLPIRIGCDIEEREKDNARKTERGEKGKEHKIRWEKEKAKQFECEMEKRKEEDGSEYWDGVKRKIWGVANSVGMVKVVGKSGSKRGERKLSAECAESKKRVW